MPLFEVSPAEIVRLDPFAFVDVMNHLLRAEADSLGILPSDVDTTLRTTDPDGGVDAAVTAPDSLVERWIPVGRSVWQFKASDLASSKKLREEFNKPGVQAALERGGGYRLIIGEELTPIKVDNRRKWLSECLKERGLNLEQGKILFAPQIAQWASEHLAIAQLPYFRRPLGDLTRFDEWAKRRIHQVPFCEDTERHKIIATIRDILSGQNKLNHLRIEGRPGVGKTRLALEAFRSPGLRERVLYASNPDEIPQGLFAWIRANHYVRAILIVDECDADRADRMAHHADECGGRVVVLTIGQGGALAVTTDFPEGIFPLEILSDQKIEEIVAKVSPSLPDEAIRFVVRMASGYVKLATALGSALVRKPGLVSAADLARSYDVQLVLSALLPDGNLRKGMKAAALLRRVGWEGEVAQEGQIVASFMGIGWTELQDSVGQVVREDLVAKQGRYRYVTPHILAVWLAA